MAPNVPAGHACFTPFMQKKPSSHKACAVRVYSELMAWRRWDDDDDDDGDEDDEVDEVVGSRKRPGLERALEVEMASFSR